MMIRSRRGRRGFTLLEIVVGLALTSALVLLAVRWVGTMGQLAALSAARSDPARSAAYLADRLGADIEQAGSCDSQRRDTAIADISSTQLGLYVDDNGDGTEDYVVWRLDGTRVLRGMYPGIPDATDCNFDAGSFEEFVVVDQVRDGTTAIFAPVDGVTIEPVESHINCQVGGWDLCAWDAVALRVLLDADGVDAAPVVVDEVFDLRPGDRRV